MTTASIHTDGNGHVIAPQSVLPAAPMPHPVLPQPPQAAQPIIAPVAHKNYADYAMELVNQHRIHVEKGSIFPGPQMVLHRTELAPEHEPELREKLRHLYGLNAPSAYQKPERKAMLDALATLLPVPLEIEHAAVLKNVEDFNRKVSGGGGDRKLQEAIADRQQPMLATVRDTVQQNRATPVELAKQTNGVLLYLLLQEKLLRLGYSDDVAEYVDKPSTPPSADQVLESLQKHIGVAPEKIREAAATGGVDAVGQLLGIDAPTIARIREVAAIAQERDFSMSVLHHYRYGQPLGVTVPVAQQLEAGMQKRMDFRIAEYRARANGAFASPLPIQKEELRIAELLRDTVDPAQLELLYKQGYNICYTPKSAMPDRLYGLHTKATDSRLDITGGAPIIYFSSHDKILENQQATLAHEVAHNLYPDRFTAEQVQEIDRLIACDAARLEALHTFLSDTTQTDGLTHTETLMRLHETYKAGTPEQKAAVIAATNQWLGEKGLQGITVDALFPHLTDPQRLVTMLDRAYNDLRVDGAQYHRGGAYESIPARSREMISRFAELKQVRLRGEPELLEFIAPGMNQVWTQHYIPQVKEVIAAVDAQKGMAQPVPLAPTPVVQPVQTVPANGTPAQPEGASAGAVAEPAVQVGMHGSPIVAPPLALPIAAPEGAPIAHGAGCGCGCGVKPPVKPMHTITTPAVVSQVMQMPASPTLH